MTLKEIKYQPFFYKLKNPFQTSPGVICGREGFFIFISDELDKISVGECSPLSGFSYESYDEVEQFLTTSLNGLVGQNIDENVGNIKQTIMKITELPSVRFALELAVLELAACHDQSFLEINFGLNNKSVPVNAVIGFDTPEKVLTKVMNKYKKGYRTFKIKIGREEFSDDYEVVKMIRNKFAGGISIRLDANGTWDSDHALDNLVKLSTFDIEYIEEPCRNLSCLLKLAEHSPIPIAVDESIKTFKNAEEILKFGKVDFLIIKPTVLGGIIETARLISLANELRKKIIISSSFETPVGKSALVLLASLTTHNLAHGLDTADMFQEAQIDDPFSVHDGNIIFELQKYPPRFSLGQLS